MRQWVKKLVEQFEVEKPKSGNAPADQGHELSDDRATLSYVLDTYAKHLFDVANHPLRKTRETFESYTKELLGSGARPAEDALFRLRQFFAAYRIAESTYVQKTFEDFKAIIWDFADQLGEDARDEKARDQSVLASLAQLREAVEANSIDELRLKSREFINFYVNFQAQKDEKRVKRMARFRKNLTNAKKQLTSAHRDMMTDHLTGAFNRKSFDEQLRQQLRLFEFAGAPASLVLLDIDHFKKVNDTHGHDIGDFVIKECVRMTKAVFHREGDFVARIGGEEFAVIIPDATVEVAAARVEELVKSVRSEVFVQGPAEIRFTISLGIAQINEGETAEAWLKRSDEALYFSKHNGRNRWTVADAKIVQAA